MVHLVDFNPQYPADEWSEEADEIMDERQKDLTTAVYIYLCASAVPNGYFRFEANTYINEIAFGCLKRETASLLTRAHEYGNYDSETWFIFSVREAIDIAIVHLHELGLIEWVIRNGWPWIHIPSASDVATLGGQSSEYHLARIRRISELKRMPYREYLLSSEWQERRNVHLENARFQCQICNSTGPLQVHHRTYARRGDERFSDLIVLCGKCHHLFHKNLRLAQ